MMLGKAKLLLLLFVSSGVAMAQSIPISNDGFHLYGPNSTWGAHLKVGGNGWINDGHASVSTTNGNLHLDPKGSFATFINYYVPGNTYINGAGGSVGINNITPQEKLDVTGNIRVERIRNADATFSANSRNSFNSFNSGAVPSIAIGWISADFGGVDNTSDRLVMGVGWGGKAVLGTHNHNLTEWGGDLLINPSAEYGNVGIGTTTPQEKLSVNGKIKAKEVKVQPTGWSDYVFEDNYQLLSLSEISSFIKKNKHLPDVPSAKEVAQNGIELGEMNKTLLKKIEELTLLLIEQHKKNEDQDVLIKKLIEKFERK